MQVEVDKFDSSFGDTPELIQQKIYADDRGFFGEVWRNGESSVLSHACQVNHSYSASNTVRGMHWQCREKPLGKYVTCISGVIQDVVVDLRKSSKTFKGWKGFSLVDPNFSNNLYRHVLWVPPGFAHGFLVISQTAHVLYLQDGFYCPASERSFHYEDPEIGIKWRAAVDTTFHRISEKDANAPLFSTLTAEDLF